LKILGSLLGYEQEVPVVNAHVALAVAGPDFQTTEGEMVIKTDLCAFSGLKIWPGHGQRYVRVDNRNFLFVTKKTAKYFQMKRNPRKLPWTMFYRHLHRKGNSNEDAKKNKVRRARLGIASVLQRGIAGITAEDLKNKRTETNQRRTNLREAQIRDIKDRKKKAESTKKAAAPPKGGKAPAQAKAPAPKNVSAKGR